MGMNFRMENMHGTLDDSSESSKILGKNTAQAFMYENGLYFRRQKFKFLPRS